MEGSTPHGSNTVCARAIFNLWIQLTNPPYAARRGDYLSVLAAEELKVSLDLWEQKGYCFVLTKVVTEMGWVDVVG